MADNFESFIPENAYEIYNKAIMNNEYLNEEKFSNAIISQLRKQVELDNLPELSEGIENRLKKAVQHASTYDELLDSLKTKRYTLARVRRLVLSAFLDMDCCWLHEEVPYLNVLGFSKVGEMYLKEISKRLKKPLVFSMKPSKSLDKKTKLLLNKECERNDVYMSLLYNSLPCKSDYTNGIIKRMD